MATLITLRRRIKAAQNISKTTKAFQMIAASRLKKAQEATLASRPYVKKLSELVYDVAGKTDENKKHPYMTIHSDTTKTLLIALSPDKGLCGGLITNLIKEFLAYQKQQDDLSYIVVGKKIEGQVIKLNREILASFSFGTSLPTFDLVYPIISLINDYYLSGKVSKVQILYTDFNSFFSQTPKIATILPVSIPEENEVKAERFQLYEPNITEMLPDLLKHYIEMSLYQVMLESYLSEQASRMLAMQNATDNAKEIIEVLKLEYNKTRQAKITSELLDITGGRGASH